MLVEDEVASFVVSYKQQTNPSQLTVEQTKVFPEVVLPEVIKLNQSVCNEQKNKGIKYSFLQKKSCRKRKMDSKRVNPSRWSMDCVKE